MIKKLINDYIQENGIGNLQKHTGVSEAVINAIITDNPKKVKFRVTTLDALYEFFRLVKDNFYMENMKKRHPNTDSILGSYLRSKRIALGYSMEEIAHELKSTKLTIIRIELGEVLPQFGSYTMQNLMFKYKLDPIERQLVKNYIQATKDIETLLKKSK